MATKTEIERLAVVETKITQAVSDIAEVKTTVNAGFAELNTKIDNLDSKYAAKWVQSAVAFVIGIIVSAVLVALVALVIVKPKDTTTTTTESPATSQTTTTTSPSGSTPSANANASAQSSPSNPTDSQSSSSGGLLDEIPKL